VILQLNQEHLQTIHSHAESTYPFECCGIILGISKAAVEVISTENAFPVESEKNRRYAIAPEMMLKTQREARDKSLNIIGIYHSHPDYPAIPSECDRELAWQLYSYIIVSVVKGKASDSQSWTLDENHQFQPEEIQLITPNSQPLTPNS
jgi:proteasome lid subunit RPN8/RPN11